MTKTTNKGPMWLRVIAILLMLGPVWAGLAQAVFTAMAFQAIGEAGGMNKDLRLSQSIAGAHWALIIGFGVCPVGFLLRRFARRFPTATPPDESSHRPATH